MNDYRVITNYNPRDIIDAGQLNADERAEFDYLDWQAIEEGRDSASFIRYRGELYDLSDFEVWHNPESPVTRDWQAFRSDSFFSGLLIRYADEHCESVIVARYYC